MRYSFNRNQKEARRNMTVATGISNQILAPVLARFIVCCITAYCTLTASAVSAQPASTGSGQAYPNKPIRMIVPQAVGSPGDFWARQIAAKSPEVFGQNLIVDNRPGANGFIGAEAAARAPADGYTLLMTNSITHVYNPWLYRKLPYRDIEDFAPVTLTSGGPLMLAVNPKVPARTLAELIALAKAKPGEINYAIGGARGYALVVMEQFKRATGINVVGVPYKALGTDLPDVIGGQVAITFNFLAILDPLMKAGRLRVLAVAAPNRLPAAPDIPTFAEAGAPGVELLAWSGLFVPAGTPRDIITRIHKGFAQIIQAPAFRAEQIRLGSLLGGSSPEEFNAFWRADRARTGKVLAEAGILPE
jgi:tripartite-type tricarboxylate transporter receptor subunit TctC